MTRTQIVASTVILGACLAGAAIVGAAAFSPGRVARPHAGANIGTSNTKDDTPAGKDTKLKTKDFDGQCAEITKPVEIEKTTPKYPESARQDRVMGMVIVETVISDEGLVEDVRVVESPDERLSAAAVEAVREWRFEPALCDGKPASVYYNLTVNFKLE